MGRLFGTDGVRGIANTELTAELALRIGKAACAVLIQGGVSRPTVVIGKDTRQSSAMLEAALCAGCCAAGADVMLLGVIPTPAVAYLAGHYGASMGVMISASHNPYEYNGIKLFRGDGFKLPDETDDEIERLVTADAAPVVDTVGTVRVMPHAVQDYVAHLVACAGGSLCGMKLVVDCANGAASTTAETLFTALGANVTLLGNTPDGVNINDGCGSTHLAALAEYVKTHEVAGGVAFDGDADRCLFVDEQGEERDGDSVLAALAKTLKQQNKLPQNTVVATVMSNLGFVRYCEAQGITVSLTTVGDRYVLERMREGGFSLGGEQSGHIILLDDATTGDGQLAAIKLLCAAVAAGEPLSRFLGGVERYPQLLKNIPANADQKARYAADTALPKLIQELNASFGGTGRVLVRVSGTEPLIRVMAEGKDESTIQRVADTLAARIREVIT